MRAGDVGRRVARRAGHDDLGASPRPVERRLDVTVGDLARGARPVQRDERDTAGAGRAGGTRREPGRPLGDRRGPARTRHRLVHQAPLHGPAAAHPGRVGGEVVRQVAAHPALVGQPGQPAGAGQDAEQRQLGQRHGRRAVVDQHDVLAGQRELVTAAGGGAVERREIGLPRARGGVLHRVARLVGELAEVHLPAVLRRGQHPDIRTGAEDPVLAAGEHHDAHLGMLEAQPLGRVVQLDVDAQVVRVEFQLVAGHQAAGLVDVHRQGGDRALDGVSPVPVTRGLGAEIDAHAGCCRAGHVGQARHGPPPADAGWMTHPTLYKQPHVRQ